jgi:hypothetical protein
MTLEGLFFVNMCGGYVESLRMVNDCKWIAATINRQYPPYEIKRPPIKQGALDWSFLLDNVRHISRYLQ